MKKDRVPSVDYQYPLKNRTQWSFWRLCSDLQALTSPKSLLLDITIPSSQLHPSRTHSSSTLMNVESTHMNPNASCFTNATTSISQSKYQESRNSLIQNRTRLSDLRTSLIQRKLWDNMYRSDANWCKLDRNCTGGQRMHRGKFLAIPKC